jgi:hypothetical protein
VIRNRDKNRTMTAPLPSKEQGRQAIGSKVIDIFRKIFLAFFLATTLFGGSCFVVSFILLKNDAAVELRRTLLGVALHAWAYWMVLLACWLAYSVAQMVWLLAQFLFARVIRKSDEP